MKKVSLATWVMVMVMIGLGSFAKANTGFYFEFACPDDFRGSGIYSVVVREGVPEGVVSWDIEKKWVKVGSMNFKMSEIVERGGLENFNKMIGSVGLIGKLGGRCQDYLELSLKK